MLSGKIQVCVCMWVVSACARVVITVHMSGSFVFVSHAYVDESVIHCIFICRFIARGGTFLGKLS